ncbi:MAG: hypothetical protein L0220_34525, partial [Acidobacteria bacterium]|nr:hypothetical protein [Acidobacteriota bacterium]
MTRSTRLSVAAALFPFILFFTVVSYGQDRSLPEDEFYGDIKVALSSHYTGKIVKVKQMIPATRRGLEILDGALQNSSAPTPPQALAQPGDELV